MTRFLAVVSAAIVVAASACGGRSQPGAAPPRTDRETLTAEELNQRAFYSAYEAIDALRPLWLSRRGVTESEVQVYVDDNRMGGVASLRSVRILSIALIKHLDGIQATARYGRGHDAGAILITTRAAGR